MIGYGPQSQQQLGQQRIDAPSGVGSVNDDYLLSRCSRSSIMLCATWLHLATSCFFSWDESR